MGLGVCVRVMTLLLYQPCSTMAEPGDGAVLVTDPLDIKPGSNDWLHLSLTPWWGNLSSSLFCSVIFSGFFLLKMLGFVIFYCVTPVTLVTEACVRAIHGHLCFGDFLRPASLR